MVAPTAWLVRRMKDHTEMTVLLLEDQPLIAMDTESMLRHAGYSKIVHFPSVEPALDWLSASLPDMVIMEIALQGQSCLMLAEQFRSRNVPFVVYTGANHRLVSDRTFLEAEWISKPSEMEVIEPAIARILERSSLRPVSNDTD
jgi:DNA-binding NtrC family response regulator